MRTRRRPRRGPQPAEVSSWPTRPAPAAPPDAAGCPGGAPAPRPCWRAAAGACALHKPGYRQPAGRVPARGHVPVGRLHAAKGRPGARAYSAGPLTASPAALAVARRSCSASLGARLAPNSWRFPRAAARRPAATCAAAACPAQRARPFCRLAAWPRRASRPSATAQRAACAACRGPRRFTALPACRALADRLLAITSRAEAAGALRQWPRVRAALRRARCGYADRGWTFMPPRRPSALARRRRCGTRWTRPRARRGRGGRRTCAAALTGGPRGSRVWGLCPRDARRRRPRASPALPAKPRPGQPASRLARAASTARAARPCACSVSNRLLPCASMPTVTGPSPSTASRTSR